MCVLFVKFQSIKRKSIIFGKKNLQSELVYKDADQALKIIVHENWDKPDFVKEAEITTNDKGERIYSTPETACWWNEIQVSLNYTIYLCVLQFELLLWF